MKRTRVLPTLPFTIVTVAAFLLTGCADGQDESAAAATESSSTTAEETTTAEEPDQGVVLTVNFDGDTCTYDGPTELSPGAVTITLVNKSSKTAYVDVAKLNADVTFEDFVAFHTPEPHEGARPDQLATFDFGETQAYGGDNGSTSGALETGEYALACLQRGNANALVWIARPGGVTVTE
jgi:hypothetical protein